MEHGRMKLGLLTRLSFFLFTLVLLLECSPCLDAVIISLHSTSSEQSVSDDTCELLLILYTPKLRLPSATLLMGPTNSQFFGVHEDGNLGQREDGQFHRTLAWSS